jgi:hypothetical protein
MSEDQKLKEAKLRAGSSKNDNQIESPGSHPLSNI